MVAHIRTVAFQGIETLPIDVQVQLTAGLPAFNVVGLPDKAVAESRERVRGALSALGLSLPPKRITVNLSPADVLKEGSHFDLPIALGLLTVMEALPSDCLDGYLVLGELALDGRIAPVTGVLPAAMRAVGESCGLICPEAQGAEAAVAGNFEILAAPDLISAINHLQGIQLLQPPVPKPAEIFESPLDLADIKGQESAKRCLEIAAAGGHNMLMRGPPGSGKSMLAARLPGILPPMEPAEALEVSLIQSISGLLQDASLSLSRPFRDPHHSCSVPALVGGGSRAKPGEISLSHNGVLFLDELPEFTRQALESLRQPLETGRAVVARVNAHVSYPARVQLVAAMNPCRCGYLADPERACTRAPRCAGDYQAKISGPLLDRIDLHIDVPAVAAVDLATPPPSESSRTIAKRVAAARRKQRDRFARQGVDLYCNAQADGTILENMITMKQDAQDLLQNAANQLKLSARGYHRILRVARTLADLNDRDMILRKDIAEALSYRQPMYSRHAS